MILVAQKSTCSQNRGLGTYVSLEKWCRTTYIVTSSKHCQNIMLDMEIEVMGVVLKNKWWKIKKQSKLNSENRKSEFENMAERCGLWKSGKNN